MKKWVNVNWDEIQPGDEICPEGKISQRITVKHIGYRYCKAVGFKKIIPRYTIPNGWVQCQYQRYEETELPDGWYLCERGFFTQLFRYKKGNQMYNGDSEGANNRGPVSNYKILKRVRFEELED